MRASAVTAAMEAAPAAEVAVVVDPADKVA
jgi:hypothetical protein